MSCDVVAIAIFTAVRGVEALDEECAERGVDVISLFYVFAIRFYHFILKKIRCGVFPNLAIPQQKVVHILAHLPLQR